jgi:D-aminoacyl-tRNA deacylase
MTMKLVIQRVKKASVSVGGEIVGEIGSGLFVLVGIGQEDTLDKVFELAIKLAKLRIMADGSDKMNLSVKDANGQILAVSQFTLYADTSAGNRPSFVKAMEPVKARQLYEKFVSELQKEDIEVQTGRFGEYMNIECDLDGPVTIILEN